MTIDPLSDAKIVDSWLKNAEPWTSAVRNEQIESRRLVTNQAIIDAVLARRPVTALDIGCGEGWLARALGERGVRVLGVDVVPALIEQARRAGGGDFRVMSYEEMARGGLGVRSDVAIANFSLIGGESVSRLLASVHGLLEPDGALIIQTLHPMIAGGDQPYEDGWRAGSWSGFSGEFTDPAPWYFRTIGGWVRLLTTSGLRLVEVREPIHPGIRRPASIIFVAEVAG
jgi:2-polyprenyl-3-methyl-5-hydroxy-6-metoxy-1,4-benzoquinol methylase